MTLTLQDHDSSPAAAQEPIALSPKHTARVKRSMGGRAAIPLADEQPVECLGVSDQGDGYVGFSVLDRAGGRLHIRISRQLAKELAKL